MAKKARQMGHEEVDEVMSRFVSSLRSFVSRSSEPQEHDDDESAFEDDESDSRLALENGCHPPGMAYCPDCHGGDYLE